ncbi:helix-turn-helix transcriptional regulator [Fodinisporobacter ferrooxydans]|uniref:Helix-turn-helix transcriptional regulator n=1 Tax=Fodinisporobacter ferrooxydans TaxID=2901836 RepID=A0ABY4CN27_9BACL|nr:helix-turn-helix transcriptional regulator [Alicyclobacillaceae bacterium MYW30-H2]
MKIEEIRKKKGVTKTHIAKKCGRSVSWYCGIATGRRKPNVDSIRMIAEALDVDVRIFFDQQLSETLNNAKNEQAASSA